MAGPLQGLSLARQALVDRAVAAVVDLVERASTPGAGRTGTAAGGQAALVLDLLRRAGVVLPEVTLSTAG